MRQLLAFLLFAGASLVSLAYPSAMTDPIGPAEDSQRAFGNLDAVARSPLVDGDWALQAEIKSGRGANSVSATVNLLGGWNEQVGRWQRLQLPNTTQWLILGTQVWPTNTPNPQPLSSSQIHTPIIARIPLSWDIFTMDFLSWSQRNYLGVVRIRGRWSDKVQLQNSDPAGAYQSAIVWSDTEFGAPMQAQLFDAQGNLVTQVSAISLKKVDSQWILRKWEVLDTLTHAKVRVTINAVALNQSWSKTLSCVSSTGIQWPEIDPTSWNIIE